MSTPTTDHRFNWLERSIAFVSPEMAARRVAARLKMALIAKELRKYDSTAPGRAGSGWKRPSTSANAEIGPALATLRNGARELVRNNPYAASAVRKLTSHMIGTGLTPRIDRTTDADPKAYNDTWQAFVEECDVEGMHDFYSFQALVARTIVESGEALVVYQVQPSRSGLAVPLTCRVLEPDWLDTAKTEALAGGGRIVQGVEYDDTGRRVAYWLFDEHPGEILPIGRGRMVQSRRVDAKWIDHVFDVIRPGQVRGVPWFAPVALKLNDLRDYDEAELVRKKLAACFAAFVTRPDDGEDSAVGGSTRQDGDKIVEQFEPGMIVKLPLGHEVNFAEPKDVPGYAEYMKAQLHAVAAGIGTPYAQLTGDVSGANYSSLREGKLDFWALLDHWQWHMMVRRMCRNGWRRAMTVAASAGRPVSPEMRALWAVPERPWVDPKKDIEAKVLAINAGIESWADVVAERGRDPQEHLEEIAAFDALAARLGVTLPSGAPGARVPAANSDAKQEEDSNAEVDGQD